ncbi:unnamed protein product [Caenorhabditis auriculariae]|uniref:Mediator complex subunit Med12 domain-containing protein n=1 Tax=Caenorhabditis auriculariae TaxID=2777116 RepID=A0A8S1H2V5_9PELO|nr:unnamed protein product [Caenorhabditis auriculariae]
MSVGPKTSSITTWFQQGPDKRPVRKQTRLGPPDVFPQDPRQEEDQLTTERLKKGYQYPVTSYEHESLVYNGRVQRLERLEEASYKANVLIALVMYKKGEFNATLDKERKKNREQISAQMTLCPAKAMLKERMMFFTDLSRGKALSQLAKRVPQFRKKEEILEFLYEFRIPMYRALWFYKMTAVLSYSQSSSGKQKKTVSDSCSQALSDFSHMCGKHLRSLIFPNMAKTTEKIAHEKWTYATTLFRRAFDEGVLDRQEFLNELCEVFSECFVRSPPEFQKQETPTQLRMYLLFLIKFTREISWSLILARRTAHMIAMKIRMMYDQSEGWKKPSRRRRRKRKRKFRKLRLKLRMQQKTKRKPIIFKKKADADGFLIPAKPKRVGALLNKQKETFYEAKVVKKPKTKSRDKKKSKKKKSKRSKSLKRLQSAGHLKFFDPFDIMEKPKKKKKKKKKKRRKSHRKEPEDVIMASPPPPPPPVIVKAICIPSPPPRISMPVMEMDYDDDDKTPVATPSESSAPSESALENAIEALPEAIPKSPTKEEPTTEPAAETPARPPADGAEATTSETKPQTEDGAPSEEHSAEKPTETTADAATEGAVEAAAPPVPPPPPIILKPEIPKPHIHPGFAALHRCAHYRSCMHLMSGILHSIVVDAPSAVIWNPFMVGMERKPPILQQLCGSPLDPLPCPVYELPVPLCKEMEKFYEVLKLRHTEVVRRSQAVHDRWNFTNIDNFAFGKMVEICIDVIGILDSADLMLPHTVDYCCDRLFNFKSKFFKEEIIIRIKLMLVWAITEEREGTYRATFISKILQHEMYRKQIFSFGGISIQDIILNFYYTEGPRLGDPRFFKEFHSLMLLFLELMRFGLFSHDLFVKSLIRTGESDYSRPLMHKFKLPIDTKIENKIKKKKEKNKEKSKKEKKKERKDKERKKDKKRSRSKDNREGFEIPTLESFAALDDFNLPPPELSQPEMIPAEDKNGLYMGENGEPVMMQETDGPLIPPKFLSYPPEPQNERILLADAFDLNEKLLIQLPLRQVEFHRSEANQRSLVLYGIDDYREAYQIELHKIAQEICKVWTKRVHVQFSPHSDLVWFPRRMTNPKLHEILTKFRWVYG